MKIVLFFTIILFTSVVQCFADENDPEKFDDTLLEEAVEHPDWFSIPSGNLTTDLEEALAEGKQGIILYFGQDHCAYCEQFLKLDLGTDDIKRYVQAYFNVIPVDIWGIEDIKDTDGITYTERELSIKYETNFTPALIFYDAKGEKVFRLRGFYPPYRFRAALKFVVEKFYKKESYRDYLKRAEPGLFFYEEGLNERDFFSPPPFNLDRSKVPGAKPLAVFFEQGNCHACDLLHSGPLNDERPIKELEKMEVVQLNMLSDVAITTPGGKQTTSRQWADDLGLFHAPSILFFDENGNEVFRVDSVVQFYRMWGVLDYINKTAWKETRDYQKWRLLQRDLKE